MLKISDVFAFGKRTLLVVDIRLGEGDTIGLVTADIAARELVELEASTDAIFNPPSHGIKIQDVLSPADKIDNLTLAMTWKSLYNQAEPVERFSSIYVGNDMTVLEHYAGVPQEKIGETEIEYVG